MFDSLADQIRKDERATEKSTTRFAVWAVALVVVILIFGGVYLATRLIH